MISLALIFKKSKKKNDIKNFFIQKGYKCIVIQRIINTLVNEL